MAAALAAGYDAYGYPQACNQANQLTHRQDTPYVPEVVVQARPQTDYPSAGKYSLPLDQYIPTLPHKATRV